MKTGKNDPCPCGSGKKFKKCCSGKEQTNYSSPGINNVMEEIKNLLEGKSISSLEEVQGYISGHMNRINRGPNADFQGLSPEEMHRFLYFPFDSPELVAFPVCLDKEPTAPITTLFGLLAEAIGDKGLKPTDKGNLPRNFCREAALALWGEEKYRHNTRFRNINKEEDFQDLHITRVVAEIAGLVRKYRGRFILSSDCRKILARKGMTALYPLLFKTYVTRFNWPYRDHYQEIRIIQQSFLFTLYLLNRYGDEPKPRLFYEDLFLHAFPMAADEAKDSPFFDAKEEARSCYSWRTLVNFAAFFGLAELESELPDDRFIRQYQVKKAPLFDAVVRFHLPVQ